MAVLSGAEQRSRRAVLVGVVGGLGALAARSLGAAPPVEAANAVQLGGSNSETSATVVRNTATAAGSVGVAGRAAAANGIGLQGEADGSNGTGVRGTGSIGVTGSGTSIGVKAVAPIDGTGVMVTGAGYGVHVKSAATYAFFNDAGPVVGVYARGSGSGGDFTGGTYGANGLGATYGLQGIAIATSGTTYGVYGDATASVAGVGVYGISPSIGVKGHATASTGTIYGMYADATASANGVGVYGTSSGVGVQGHASGSVAQIGVWGISPSIGMQGGSGIFFTPAVTGVVGHGTNKGVYGEAPTTEGHYGVYCDGNMYTTGTQNSASSLLTIDHPQDPEHTWLSHAHISAPEPLNVYRGTVAIDASGAATVSLPGYFAALNGDVSYQLTAMGAAAPSLHVAQEVRGNQFRVAGGVAGQKVSWQVTGVRQDAYAAAHPLRVETRKNDDDQGTLQFVPKGSLAKSMHTGPVPGSKRRPPRQDPTLPGD